MLRLDAPARSGNNKSYRSYRTYKTYRTYRTYLQSGSAHLRQCQVQSAEVVPGAILRELSDGGGKMLLRLRSVLGEQGGHSAIEQHRNGRLQGIPDLAAHVEAAT